MISQHDVIRLRDLAKQVAQIAATPANLEKKQGWYDINDLKQGAKPRFITHLWQISTPEIFPAAVYQCESEEARAYELDLMQRIYFATVLNDDNVVEPVIYYHPVYELTPFPRLSFEQHKNDEGSQGSYEMVPTIVEYDDGEKLKDDPILNYDRTASEAKLAQAKEIFEPILTVVQAPVQFAAKVVDEFSWLRGMEQSYIDMMDDPEWMRECLQSITDNFNKRYDLLEQSGLWGTHDLSTPLGSAGLRYISGMKNWSDEADPAHPTGKTSDGWGFTCAELLTVCGSEQHNEFSFEYDKQVMSRFKYINVGCCEVLDKKIPLIAQLKNTRKVSVSEWCNPLLAAEQIGKKYVYSYRAAGVPFVGDPWNMASSEKEIRSVLEATKKNDCALEIVLNIGGTFGVGDARKKNLEWTELTRRLIREIYE